MGFVILSRSAAEVKNLICQRQRYLGRQVAILCWSSHVHCLPWILVQTIQVS